MTSIRLPDNPTAAWLVAGINDDAITQERRDRRVVIIENPLRALRHISDGAGEWVTREVSSAIAGTCRGAIHAAGNLEEAGLYVRCPSRRSAHKLAAAIGRLAGVAPDIGPRAIRIKSGDIPKVLAHIGIPDDVIAYLHAMHRAAKDEDRTNSKELDMIEREHRTQMVAR
ncbi:hypothetical protein B5P44_01150 [Mycobacterium sp. CBMA 213]|uniref:hypothetical protein n=1 Tax=unclassified Mycolicibacterium TaxID=2636767 RepID=UPI0012DD1B36|nr:MULTISPECIES: hypothetical protein [unclassified Mycolicibacterium]MUL61189.1 hypothetical protein [Mycolicibacterium sp. CBMA 335]MUM03427.1 hypothetical protein [Mycolicibacterium sp. CBMA 213]